MFSPALVVFISVSLLGVLFVFLSRGLLGMWISLELRFFGFLPILNGKSVAENEAAVKYFVVQTVGSGLIIVGFLFMVTGSISRLIRIYDSYLIDLLVVGRFMIKLGIFPLHFWFPSVMGMSS